MMSNDRSTAEAGRPFDLPAIWGGGQLLAFSGLDGPTDYDNGLCGRTALDGAGIELLLPGRCLIRLGEKVQSIGLLTGDAFDLATDAGRIQGAFLDAHHLLIEGPCAVDCESSALAVRRNGNRTLLGAAAHFDSSLIAANRPGAIADRERWLRAFRCDARLPEPRRRALAKALSIMKTQVSSPEGLIRRPWTTPDRWPHRALWLWDSAFHAIGWRHVDPALARAMLEAVLETQHPDGLIPITTTPSASHHLTQPPVLALAAWLVNEAAPEPGWLESLYPRLCRYVDWDLRNRDSDGHGLAEWFIQEYANCRSGESGMDNCSRFDPARPLDAVDFNAYLASECELLARIAGRRRDAAGAARWREGHARLNGLMNDRLWDEDAGLYLDAFAGTDRRTGIPSCASFLPLLSGAPDAARANRLLDRLESPALFGTPVPVPSVPPAAGPRLYTRDMWRGPMWVNMNWLIARGLDRYGFAENARALRQRTVEEIERWYERCGVFFEFYDDAGEAAPDTLPRKGRVGTVVRDYGWTATLYVDLVLHLTGTAIAKADRSEPA